MLKHLKFVFISESIFIFFWLFQLIMNTFFKLLNLNIHFKFLGIPFLLWSMLLLFWLFYDFITYRLEDEFKTLKLRYFYRSNDDDIQYYADKLLIYRKESKVICIVHVGKGTNRDKLKNHFEDIGNSLVELYPNLSFNKKTIPNSNDVKYIATIH